MKNLLAIAVTALATPAFAEGYQVPDLTGGAFIAPTVGTTTTFLSMGTLGSDTAISGELALAAIATLSTGDGTTDTDQAK